MPTTVTVTDSTLCVSNTVTVTVTDSTLCVLNTVTVTATATVTDYYLGTVYG